MLTVVATVEAAAEAAAVTEVVAAVVLVLIIVLVVLLVEVEHRVMTTMHWNYYKVVVQTVLVVMQSFHSLFHHRLHTLEQMMIILLLMYMREMS